jgi:sigma-B regulation protein RsbU (phosphoserine phosphatase)
LPALEEARVGGDFYDVFRIGEDKIGVVIGDVSGKGLNAAVQVAMAKYSVRNWAYESDNPAIIMEQVNRTLLQEMDPETFVTLFIGVLSCNTTTLSYASGGHEPVILWKADDRIAVSLEPTGPIVGMSTGVAFGECVVDMLNEDELFLGTDGLTEARRGRRLLGVDGLAEIYADLKRSGLGSAPNIVSSVVRFCEGSLRDDIAILKVSRTGYKGPVRGTRSQEMVAGDA